jgi:hypothetical protein
MLKGYGLVTLVAGFTDFRCPAGRFWSCLLGVRRARALAQSLAPSGTGAVRHEAEFIRADDAPEPADEQRRAAFRRLAALYAQRFANTVRQTNAVQGEISDLQFTTRYRVPFQFSRFGN